MRTIYLNWKDFKYKKIYNKIGSKNYPFYKIFFVVVFNIKIMIKKMI